MNNARLRQAVKPWMMPIAMVVGFLFHDAVDAVAFLAPWLIFAMLLVTFCKINLRRLSLSAMTWMLLAVQAVGAVIVYAVFAGVDPVLAQGLFICIFCPTATAAPVITAMLGGDLEKLVSFSLISNAAVALTAPTLFTVIAPGHEGLWPETLSVARRVVPLILAPLAVALALKHTAPGLHRTLAQHQSLGFYIWSCSLIIVVGRAVSFVMAEPPSMLMPMIWLATGALLCCLVQFGTGRLIGRRFGDAVSAAQGLGQKNTVLAIWMALTYLNPLASVAPAAYVVWQNSLNALQLYFHARHGKR